MTHLRQLDIEVVARDGVLDRLVANVGAARHTIVMGIRRLLSFHRRDGMNRACC